MIDYCNNETKKQLDFLYVRLCIVYSVYVKALEGDDITIGIAVQLLLFYWPYLRCLRKIVHSKTNKHVHFCNLLHLNSIR